MYMFFKRATFIFVWGLFVPALSSAMQQPGVDDPKGGIAVSEYERSMLALMGDAEAETSREFSDIKPCSHVIASFWAQESLRREEVSIDTNALNKLYQLVGGKGRIAFIANPKHQESPFSTHIKDHQGNEYTVICFGTESFASEKKRFRQKVHVRAEIVGAMLHEMGHLMQDNWRLARAFSGHPTRRTIELEADFFVWYVSRVHAQAVQELFGLSPQDIELAWITVFLDRYVAEPSIVARFYAMLTTEQKTDVVLHQFIQQEVVDGKETVDAIRKYPELAARLCKPRYWYQKIEQKINDLCKQYRNDGIRFNGAVQLSRDINYNEYWEQLGDLTHPTSRQRIEFFMRCDQVFKDELAGKKKWQSYEDCCKQYAFLFNPDGYSHPQPESPEAWKNFDGLCTQYREKIAQWHNKNQYLAGLLKPNRLVPIQQPVLSTPSQSRLPVSGKTALLLPPVIGLVAAVVAWWHYGCS